MPRARRPVKTKSHSLVLRHQNRRNKKQAKQQKQRDSERDAYGQQALFSQMRQQPRQQRHDRQNFQVSEVLARQNQQRLDPLEGSARDQRQKRKKTPVCSRRE